jgi:hypothetical protein
MCVGPKEVVEIYAAAQESEEYRPMTYQEYCQYESYLEGEE